MRKINMGLVFFMLCFALVAPVSGEGVALKRDRPLVKVSSGDAAPGDDGRIYDSAPFSGPEYEVEKITADAYAATGQVVVSGVVKNHLLRPVKGYVVVYLLNSHNDLIKSVEASVNDNRMIASKDGGAFEASARLAKNITDIKRVYVEFVKK